jgi:hypothetical protein
MIHYLIITNIVLPLSESQSRLQRERRRLIRLLTSPSELAVGSVARVHKAGERYRKWRKAANRLRAIENRQRQILLAEIKKKAVFYE